MQALLIAIWRRKSGPGQLMHSDQNAEFTSREWAASQREHKLEHFLSRKRNCQENAVAKIFFQFLNQEKSGGERNTGASQARRIEIHRAILQHESQAHEHRHIVAG
ncbi:DDE-type integrase/transposase/recombinase [Sulfitobacter mediterraneus]|nr:DDE-type integrase/transposase/recombinase [Sulfitobacter mediterraneus]MBM1634989.1 DDE-type integrase/transposase/recombinase [Sulfitobacter mediterraneus]MBM1642721.1 DDE-type integrase/transposase/recombinase [Sulfitobacter mediterraneus]MBM1646769.1 DDE-type integrase/transposase/recombinase [Sulfitobacter mediterraneus]MBM1650902.1 DDE-type integrase/transposase/recombinase [Sulfitobacter mediterraneus]MBM1654837.1 DDE-type integrase/transposase/recombinase [Sulfitobacter mediterraneu